MSVDLNDDLEQQPIDLFAVPTVSQEGFAFPIEDFIPTAKKEPLDEPASNEPDEEINVEVNPNKPDETIVDVVESGTIRELTEQDFLDVHDLMVSRENLIINQGVSKDDIVILEKRWPGLITERTPLNRFGTIASMTGLTVSCESLLDAALDIVDRIIEAIGRLIDRILNGKAIHTPSVMSIRTGQSRSLESQWDDIQPIASKLDGAGRERINFSERNPGSEAAKRALTAKQFAKLFSEENLKLAVADITMDFNRVTLGHVEGDLNLVYRSLNELLRAAEVRVVQPAEYQSKGIDNVEFKQAYQHRGVGRVKSIEYMIKIEAPNDLIKQCGDFANHLRQIQTKLKDKRQKDSEDRFALKSVGEIGKIITDANLWTDRLSIIVEAYDRYNRVMSKVLNQTESTLMKYQLT